MHETGLHRKDFGSREQAAAETIAREVKDRYGVDVANLTFGPQVVGEHFDIYGWSSARRCFETADEGMVVLRDRR